MILWCCLLAVLYLAGSSAENVDDWRLVTIAQGPVRGRRETEGVFAFYNIPYATAPTGENKFKAPLPPPYWTAPLEAIDKGVICHQADFKADRLNGKNKQEQCLIANIYVPDTDRKNLSVVVLIHGGAFQIGFGDWNKATELMKSKKIIVVNFNYRLGIPGFLCLGTKDVPGNAGMKDMVALLRWVQKNIASFGGNPDDVTISGYSAGAAAADLLILSKSANNLFKKVIIESGSSIAAYAIQNDPLAIAKSHAKSLNFSNFDDICALEKFYKNVSYDVLTAHAFIKRMDSTFKFAPCVERYTGEDMFLDDSPINILESGNYLKVPMLYGFTNMEGLMRIGSFDSWKGRMDLKFSEFLPPDLIFSTDDEKLIVAETIKGFYFGNEAVDTGTILGYVDFFTDLMFAYPALKSVKLNVQSGNDQIYLYYYSFVDNDVPYVPHTKVRGATHCAQTSAIFDDLKPKNITVQFKNFRNVIRKMWHNFVTDGKPVPKNSSLPLTWPPVSANKCKYMSLGEVGELRHELLEDHFQFWDHIYEKYHRTPYPPPEPKSPACE